MLDGGRKAKRTVRHTFGERTAPNYGRQHMVTKPSLQCVIPRGSSGCDWARGDQIRPPQA